MSLSGADLVSNHYNILKKEFLDKFIEDEKYKLD
jgi:hypothetical protein